VTQCVAHDDVADCSIVEHHAATANDRSPTVEYCDWRTSSWSVTWWSQTSSGRHVI